MTLNERKSALLSAIIKEHISTGQTVASKALVDKRGFSLSPATIRNEMGDLEESGYIYQPHTSAGRIPTEKGWKFYIENFLKSVELTQQEKTALDKILKEHGLSYEGAVKNVAKQMAELSREAIFVGFSADDFYYTGLSHLFAHPEFQKIDLVCHLSEVVDHLDEVMNKMFDEMNEEVKIMVGSENPFGKECGSIVTGYTFGDKGKGLFGILGPMRMDYENNLALIKYTQALFSQA
jgi:transcriptional regulator of heat shock response